jgi:hypothetical protein
MKRLEDFVNLPTIMWIDQEISVMHDLMEMPKEYISSNRAGFAAVLDDLDLSHTGGGYFGLTRSNEMEFKHFADWLDSLNNELRLALDPLLIEDFRFSYDDLTAAYPSILTGEDASSFGQDSSTS